MKLLRQADGIWMPGQVRQKISWLLFGADPSVIRVRNTRESVLATIVPLYIKYISDSYSTHQPALAPIYPFFSQRIGAKPFIFESYGPYARHVFALPLCIAGNSMHAG